MILGKWKTRRMAEQGVSYSWNTSSASVDDSDAADTEDRPALRKDSDAEELPGYDGYERTYSYVIEEAYATFEDDDEVEEDEEAKNTEKTATSGSIPSRAWNQMRSPPPETVPAEDQPRVETEALNSPPLSLPSVYKRNDSETGSIEALPQRYETMTLDADAAMTTALKQREEDKSRSKEMLGYYEKKLAAMSKNEEKYQSLIVQLRSQLVDAKKPTINVENSAIEETPPPADDEEIDSDGDNSSVDSDMAVRQRDFLKERIGAALAANDFSEAEKYLREGLKKLNMEDKPDEKVGWNANLAEVLILQKKYEDALKAAREILVVITRDNYEQGINQEADKANAHVIAAKALMGIGGNATQRKEAKSQCKKALKIVKNMDAGELQKVGRQDDIQGRKRDAMLLMSMILDAEGETIEAAFYRSLFNGKGRHNSTTATATEEDEKPRLQAPLKPPMPPMPPMPPPMPTTVSETREEDKEKATANQDKIKLEKVKLAPELTKIFGLYRGVYQGRVVTRKMGAPRAEQEEIYSNATKYIMDLPESDALRLAYSLYHDMTIVNTAAVNSNSSPLHLAIKKTKWCIAAMLISRGADVNALNTAKRSPLHLAANYRGAGENEPALYIMIQLLERGAEIDRATGAPNSSRQGNLSSRLEQGVQPGPIPEGYTPLMIAVVNNNAKAVRLLMAYGANPNIQLPVSRVTALHLAVSLRKDELVTILLEEGADYNIKNSDGRTARDIAPRSSRQLDGQVIHWEEVFDKAIKKRPGPTLSLSSAMSSNTKGPPPPPPPLPPSVSSGSSYSSYSVTGHSGLQAFRQARVALKEEKERSSSTSGSSSNVPLRPPSPPRRRASPAAPPPPPPAPPAPPSSRTNTPQSPPPYTRTGLPPPPPPVPPSSRSPLLPPSPPPAPLYSATNSSHLPPLPPQIAMMGPSGYALMREFEYRRKEHEHRRMGSASLASDLRGKSPSATSPPPAPPPTSPPPPPPPPSSGFESFRF